MGGLFQSNSATAYCGAQPCYKTVLGWLIDTLAMTIQLTPTKHQRLLEILAEYPRSRHRVSLKDWQRVLGELRFMAVALPGARGLFSTLQVL